MRRFAWWRCRAGRCVVDEHGDALQRDRRFGVRPDGDRAGSVALHVLAILFYKWVRKDNLVRPMVLGDKQVEAPLPSAPDSTASRLLALVIWAVCGAAVYWLVGLGQTSWG